MIHADDIRVDTDEGEFVLVIDHEQGTFTVNIHGVVLGFYRTMQREVGPYADEAQLARATMPTADPDDGYAPDDPKHPTWHDRMVGGA